MQFISIMMFVIPLCISIFAEPAKPKMDINSTEVQDTLKDLTYSKEYQDNKFREPVTWAEGNYLLSEWVTAGYFNHDGLEDLACLNYMDGELRILVFLSSGGEFDYSNKKEGWLLNTSFQKEIGQILGFRSADFNSDLLDDIAVLALDKKGCLQVHVLLSKNFFFSVKDTLWFQGDKEFNHKIIFFESGTFDEDMSSDIIFGYDEKGVLKNTVLLSKDYYFKENNEWKNNSLVNDFRYIVVGDFTGDFLTDIATIESHNDGILVNVSESTGISFKEKKTFLKINPYEVGNIKKVCIGNFDGIIGDDIALLIQKNGNTKIHVFTSLGSEMIFAKGYSGWWNSDLYKNDGILYFGTGNFDGWKDDCCVIRKNRGLVKIDVFVANFTERDLGVIVQEIESYLGKDLILKKNSAGDIILISKDGQRKMRFDINNPHPHRQPHIHIEYKTSNGKWKQHFPRIYLKPKNYTSNKIIPVNKLPKLARLLSPAMIFLEVMSPTDLADGTLKNQFETLENSNFSQLFEVINRINNHHGFSWGHDEKSFSEAFREARNDGMRSFSWDGKSYNTREKDESRSDWDKHVRDTHPSHNHHKSDKYYK